MLLNTITTIPTITTILLLRAAVVESLARCHQTDLSYQILSGWVFTHTPSIISTQVSQASHGDIFISPKCDVP